MDDFKQSGGDKRSEPTLTAERASSESSKNCLEELMLEPRALPTENAKNGFFDPSLPLSHFLQVGNDVYRSGRPNGEDGVKDLVEKMWGNDKFDPEQAKHTTVIDLRGAAKFPNYQANEDSVHQEAQIEASLGVTNRRFGMETQNYIDHTFIQSILDYVDQQKADGQRVSLHCQRGTDRTGTITAAYELTHDQQLEQLVKNHPDQAYQAGLKYMSDNGCVTSNFPALTKSLKDFVNWKHAEMNGQAGANDISTANYLEVPPLSMSFV